MRREALLRRAAVWVQELGTLLPDLNTLYVTSASILFPRH
jgi:hypothetical protein